MVAMHATHSPSTRTPQRPVEPTDTGRREESYLHYLARESQFYLEILIIVSLVMTVLLMVSFFFFAFIPVIVLLLSYGLLVLANAIQRRTAEGAPFAADEREGDWQRARGEAALPRASRRTIVGTWGIRSEDALRRRLARVTLEIVAGAGLLALVMATIVMPTELVILGVGVLFCYIVFISAPFWLAWLNDESSDEEKRQANI